MAAIMHFSSLEGVRRRGDKAAHPLSQSLGWNTLGIEGEEAALRGE